MKRGFRRLPEQAPRNGSTPDFGARDRFQPLQFRCQTILAQHKVRAGLRPECLLLVHRVISLRDKRWSLLQAFLARALGIKYLEIILSRKEDDRFQ